MTSYRVPMSTISPTDTRNDLHLTSTGIGHTYRQQPETKKFKSYLLQPLPGRYSHPQPHLVAANTESTYSPTTATEHCYKPIDYFGRIGSIYKRSPTLDKINYTRNVKEQLNVKSWRSPLTMSQQRSETHERYQGKQDSIKQIIDQSNPIETTLSDHHNNGPMKTIISTDTNREMQGRSFTATDQAITHRHQPYLTTNHWYHRNFSKRELQNYPKKDVATYWSTEGYPTAWGHGPAINPLPKLPHSNRTMTDRGQASLRPVTMSTGRASTLVSNGLKTQYSSTFIDHSKANPFRRLAPPTFSSTVIDTSLMATVPKMYKTTNQTYGGQRAQPLLSI